MYIIYIVNFINFFDYNDVFCLSNYNIVLKNYKMIIYCFEGVVNKYKFLMVCYFFFSIVLKDFKRFVFFKIYFWKYLLYNNLFVL